MDPYKDATNEYLKYGFLNLTSKRWIEVDIKTLNGYAYQMVRVEHSTLADLPLSRAQLRSIVQR